MVKMGYSRIGVIACTGVIIMCYCDIGCSQGCAQGCKSVVTGCVDRMC